MSDKQKKIIPVLIGADLNCYNAARAFHEEFGVVSHAFGRYAIGATKYSRIVKFKAVENLDNPSIFVNLLETFARDNPGAALVLLGCTDEYVSLIVRNRDVIPARYIVPYPGRALMEEITLKENFYRLCEKHGIAYPKTAVIRPGEPLGELPFGYPIIIKPSSSTLYWKHPFDGMKKVYRASDKAEAAEIISSIYAGGYPEALILQDAIPGDDSNMYVLTSYSDREAKVRMMCLGHVLLEEHTPKGLGNHAAIITERNDELTETFRRLLEEIGYTGFSNFDIKYDPRDGSYRVFEINTRLGRSNYYVTAAGNNPAKIIADDFIENNPYDGCKISDDEIYWRYVPDKVVFRYIEGELAGRVRALIRGGRAFSSLRYPPDLRFNPRRRIFVMVHEHHHVKKFKKYYKK